MHFLIKSDVACPWNIDLKNLVKNRVDVLVDFVVESLRAGVEEVFLMLCDGTTYRVTSAPERSREAAGRIFASQSFKTDLPTLLGAYRHVYYLHEKGVDVSRVALEKDGLYIFGDHDGLAPADEELLARRAVWVSLGATPYRSWQAAVYVAYLLNRLR